MKIKNYNIGATHSDDIVIFICDIYFLYKSFRKFSYCIRWHHLLQIINVKKKLSTGSTFLLTVKSLYPKILLDTPLERYLCRASAHFCCIKIHAKMTEKSQIEN